MPCAFQQPQLSPPLLHRKRKKNLFKLFNIQRRIITYRERRGAAARRRSFTSSFFGFLYKKHESTVHFFTFDWGLCTHTVGPLRGVVKDPSAGNGCITTIYLPLSERKKKKRDAPFLLFGLDNLHSQLSTRKNGQSVMGQWPSVEDLHALAKIKRAKKNDGNPR
jgi:hypothetical protein